MGRFISVTFLTTSDFPTVDSHPVTLSFPEKVSSRWEDEVGKKLTDDFNSQFEKICSNAEKVFRSLEEVSSKIPSTHTLSPCPYNRRIHEIGLLKGY